MKIQIKYKLIIIILMINKIYEYLFMILNIFIINFINLDNLYYKNLKYL